MKFQVEIPNVLLKDREILIQLKKSIEEQINLLSPDTKIDLDYYISRLIVDADGLNNCWRIKAELRIGQAIDEQYFGAVEETSEDHLA